MNTVELGLVRPQTALLSVGEMKGLPRLARELQSFGINLLATRGTLTNLQAEGVGAVTDTADITGLVDGHLGIKTIHPAIHAGIKAKRDDKGDLVKVTQLGGRLIDIVVTNFSDHYPLPQCDNLDTGGGALLLQTIGNCGWVVPIASPDWYESLYHELREHDGQTSTAFRMNARANAKRILVEYLQNHP